MGTQPFWIEEFDKLDLASPSNPDGRWRPNDVWQPLDKGYNDFGAGGQSTYCVNPNETMSDGKQHSNFEVSNGILSLLTRRNPGNLGVFAPWLGCFLVTNTARPENVFGYGFYEFRVRWPNHGKGMFPALWFFAAHDADLAINKGHAEIDLLEIFGHASGRPWNITLHEKDNNGNGAQKAQHQGDDDTADWHVYAMEWSADVLKFYRDGVMVQDSSGEAGWYQNVKMGIRINYAMDAFWFSGDQKSDSSTPNPLRMEVDFIRAFRSKVERDQYVPVVIPPPVVITPAPPTSAPVTALPAPTGNREVVQLPLVSETNGSDHIVASVQALLTVRGFPVAIRAVWNTETKAALLAFQTAKGLPATGTCDAGTWARLLYA